MAVVNNEKRVSITVASYALVDTVKALAQGGITDFAITKEDNNLVIVIRESKLKELDILKLQRSVVNQ